MLKITQPNSKKMWLYICTAYVILRVTSFALFNLSGHYFPLIDDSLNYWKFAHHGIFGIGPFPPYCNNILCNRAFVYPLIIFISGYKIAVILIAQLIASIFAWLGLASILRNTIKNNPYCNLMAASILIIGLQTGVTTWDVFILSESFSVSFFILNICALWQFINKGMTWRWLIALIALTILTTGIRDTNAYLMLMAAFVLFVSVLIYHRCAWLKVLLYLICVVIMFSFSSWTSKIGYRAATSMNNIISLRILHDPVASKYFYKLGMPTTLQKQAQPKLSLVNRTIKEGALASFLFLNNHMPGSKWVMHDSKKVFVKFLLTHPKYALMPFVKSSFYIGWLANPLIGYCFAQLQKYSSPFIMNIYNTFTSIMLFVSYLIILRLLIMVLLQATNIKTNKTSKILATFGIANIIISLIMAWLIWQAGPMGIMRHQLLAYVQLVIGIIFLAFATSTRN